VHCGDVLEGDTGTLVATASMLVGVGILSSIGAGPLAPTVRVIGTVAERRVVTAMTEHRVVITAVERRTIAAVAEDRTIVAEVEDRGIETSEWSRLLEAT